MVEGVDDSMEREREREREGDLEKKDNYAYKI